MVQRYRWECPSCGRAYEVPSTAGLTICPRCVADDEPPIINVDPNHSPVYWSKTRSATPFIQFACGAAAVIFMAGVCVVLMNYEAPLDQKARTIAAGGIGIALVIGFFLLHFLPSIIAYSRAHRNFIPILILNTALGWTGIAWIGLMVWATIATPKVETERSI